MAKTERIQNMTKGGPAKLIFTFAIPLMLGNVFQQFYTVVDTAIVGQALGVNALAALGAADWLNWLVLGLIQGFAQGFSIYMATWLRMTVKIEMTAESEIVAPMERLRPSWSSAPKRCAM